MLFEQTTSIEQNPSLKAKSYSADYEITRIIWN